MRVAILITPLDFKDETLSQLGMYFGKRDIEYTIVGFNDKECRGVHGASIKPKMKLDNLQPSDFDVLLIADGPGVDSLRIFDHRPLLDMIRLFHESNKMIAGIGNGVKAVARANIIKDAKMAKPDPETEKIVRLYRGIPTEDAVVFDKNKRVITLSTPESIDGLVSILSSP